jgi:hypothetical protein
MSNQDIGSHFNRAQPGIDSIMARVFDKTGVARRSDLVSWLRDRGLVPEAGTMTAEGKSTEDSTGPRGTPSPGSDLSLGDRLEGGGEGCWR